MSPNTHYMKRALVLAKQASGTTSPNPAVGAVVVKDGIVLGEGYTLPPGQNHAEISALDDAGTKARGASLHVSLEPCCTYGRTPPCTRAIIEASITEVHVAIKDPNPAVNGKGIAELEAAGIKVYVGEEEEAAREVCEAFAKHVNTGLPFVTAKFAMSLDGKIATHTGDSKWITGIPARNNVHDIRRSSDAIAVGVNTVLRDDPQLTARDADGKPLKRQPLRVIFDGTARTSPDARLLKEPGHTLIAVTEAPANRVQSLRDAGAEVLQLPTSHGRNVDPGALMEELGKRGLLSLLVEGGGTLFGSLFDAHLVDKIAAFIAPVIIGGHDAPSAVGGTGIANMTESLRLERVRVERLGEDLLVIGYPL